ncbi:heavy metal-associated domain, HMA [Artemisia annua]|uniref:Heavy metal-associated domain, HMA n=1 Tax=Artemisia annua TaxID=35608 RepID=A0A2U1L746_ARTAN|nr:heavy metal-associated domain, HMA [Artemisia annua]
MGANASKKKIDGESSVVVLRLDLHCEGCARKAKSSIRPFKCVESVNVDMANNKIMVTGKVDPDRVKELIEETMKKKVEIVQVKSIDKKVQSITVVLKIPLHCEGCMRKIKRSVSKFKGVESVIPDASKDLVLVKGTMNVNELVPYLKQKHKREVDVVRPKKDEKSDEKKDVKKEVKSEGVEKKEKGNNGGDGEKRKKFKREVDVVLPKTDEKSDEKKDVQKEVKSEGVEKKEKGSNGGNGVKKKDGDGEKKIDGDKRVDVVLPKKDEKSDEKKDVKKEVKFEGVNKKEKGNNGGDGEKKKDAYHIQKVESHISLLLSKLKPSTIHRDPI